MRHFGRRRSQLILRSIPSDKIFSSNAIPIEKGPHTSACTAASTRHGGDCTVFGGSIKAADRLLCAGGQYGSILLGRSVKAGKHVARREYLGWWLKRMAPGDLKFSEIVVCDGSGKALFEEKQKSNEDDG